MFAKNTCETTKRQREYLVDGGVDEIEDEIAVGGEDGLIEENLSHEPHTRRGERHQERQRVEPLRTTASEQNK